MNGLELRIEDGGDGKLTLEGYASRTETPYQVGSFEETIKRGAFRRSLGENPDTSLLVNHEGLPLARTTSGNLRLEEDSRGLRVHASLEREDPDVRAIEFKMRRGDLSEMSIGFRATGQSWNEDRHRAHDQRDQPASGGRERGGQCSLADLDRIPALCRHAGTAQGARRPDRGSRHWSLGLHLR